MKKIWSKNLVTLSLEGAASINDVRTQRGQWILFSVVFTLFSPQPPRQYLGPTQRNAYREWGPCLPVGPASRTMGTEKLKLCTIGKNIFCTGPTGSAVQFFLLPLPSMIYRLNSVSTEISQLIFGDFSGKLSQVDHCLKGLSHEKDLAFDNMYG
jgi:hypothetical protein